MSRALPVKTAVFTAIAAHLVQVQFSNHRLCMPFVRHFDMRMWQLHLLAHAHPAVANARSSGVKVTFRLSETAISC
jgi:hypothetical protein